jgi:hypothetical protein
MVNVVDSSVGVVVGYRLDCWGLFHGRARDFSVLHSIQTGSGAHPSSYSLDTGECFHGIKWPGHKADHSSPSGAEVKNGGAVPPLTHIFPWHSALLHY